MQLLHKHGFNAVTYSVEHKKLSRFLAKEAVRFVTTDLEQISHHKSHQQNISTANSLVTGLDEWKLHYVGDCLLNFIVILQSIIGQSVLHTYRVKLQF